ncbi:MAG: small-conductance mechanosensitive channel [Bermanella sp.]|jgi:small-conductance mechanosensitive channel
MDITTQELREQIIHPTLEYLGKPGLGAENLLVAIVSQKQKLTSLKQKSSKGLGPFNIDSNVHQTVWDKYLAFHPDLASRIRGLASQRAFLEDPHSELATNLCYATAIAWVIYILRPSEILTSAA